MINQVIQGDCLEVMATLPSHSIDLIATDLPYGTTACSWDFIIDPVRMWQQVKRIIKPNGAFITTSSQPFTTDLISSNRNWFKYCLIWEKEKGSGFVHAKNKPLKSHEDICIFSAGTTNHITLSRNRMIYNPQGLIQINKTRVFKANNSNETNMAPRPSHKSMIIQKFSNYPKSILRFNRDTGLHPTQKPVALFEYLIKTYSNPGDLVLDCTAGSGTTGIAAINTNRNFILIEKEQKYIDIIHKRLANIQPPMQSLFSEEEMTG